MSISGSITYIPAGIIYRHIYDDKITHPIPILSPEEIIRTEVDKWDEYQRAIVYHYLNASGMNLSKAQDILNKRR